MSICVLMFKCVVVDIPICAGIFIKMICLLLKEDIYILIKSVLFQVVPAPFQFLIMI